MARGFAFITPDRNRDVLISQPLKVKTLQNTLVQQELTKSQYPLHASALLKETSAKSRQETLQDK